MCHVRAFSLIEQLIVLNRRARRAAFEFLAGGNWNNDVWDIKLTVTHLS